MGDPLTILLMDSFNDELQKLAFKEGLRGFGQKLVSRIRSPKNLGLASLARIGKFTRGGFGGIEEAGKRLAHPIKGMKEGWRMSSPLPAMEQRAKEMGFASAMDAAQALKGTDPAKYKEMLSGGEHLLGTAPDAGRVRALAEGLSRRGWTGAGRATKYLPVGMKSWQAVPPALMVPSIINAPAPTQTGENAALEQGIGELGGAAGAIMGTGIGIVPAMGLWYGGRQVGSRLGRVLDRMRAGATAKDAISAPSPTEAAQQLEDIQRYYG